MLIGSSFVVTIGIVVSLIYLLMYTVYQTLSEQKQSRSKTCSTRGWVCADVFECARMFFVCNRSNSNMRVCLCSVKFFRVCAQCCQQTNSFVFSTGAFVGAQSNSFVLARSPPNVLIPLQIKKWHLYHFETFQRAFVCARSNSIVLALSS